MTYSIRVEPGQKVRLGDIDPADTGGLKHHDGKELAGKPEEQLTVLQEALYAAAKSSVLIVLQGLDTAGKDGTITHVMSRFNPQGCQVQSFKVPTAVEAAHDFLWRAHLVTPPKGSIGIFNRSYYEDVLVVRVHKLVPKEVWKGRYAHINNFEQLLLDSGTIVLKFFLYVSKDEQEKRLRAREEDAAKSWKLSVSDWAEHRLYDDYIAAYGDALTQCCTPCAPWYIIPADHKWFRNLAVAQTIADVLQPEMKEWESELEQRGKEQLQAIAATQKR